MATNITINTIPDQWSSAYDDCVFIFDFNSYSISTITEEIVGSVGTGYCELFITGTFDVTPLTNDYIYIDSGTYAGLHKVTSSTTNSIVIDAIYVGDYTGGNVKHLRIPTFTLVKGFKPTEEFPTDLPYTNIVNFKPTFNSSYQIEINIRELLESMFIIVEPDITSSVAFGLFNAYRLVWDVDNETDKRYVLNGSISTSELNSNYIDSGQYLCNTQKPLMWGCGASFMVKFINGFPTLELYNGGQQATVGFSGGFSATAFRQGFNI